MNRPVVCSTSPARMDEASRLAMDLGLSSVEWIPDDTGSLALILTAERLELHACGLNAPGPVYAEFVGGPTGRRGRSGGVRDEALARAAGLRRSERPNVIAATAGLGRDTFILAARGCRVLAIERNPVVAALLADGLARAAREPETADCIARIELTAGEAATVLARRGPADVVLVDPMHPPRRGSAAVRKEMQVFRTLIGTDDDAPALLLAAIAAARRRVVVKRPRAEPPLSGPAPTGAVESRSVRFDIYPGAAGGGSA